MQTKSEEVKTEGFTLDKYNQEYVEAGALSENSYAELAKLGLDKLEEAIKTPPKKWVVTDWLDLTQMEIFKNKI